MSRTNQLKAFALFFIVGTVMANLSDEHWGIAFLVAISFWCFYLKRKRGKTYEKGRKGHHD